MATEYWQKVAHQNANKFAHEKVDDMILGFFRESGLLAILRDKDVIPNFPENPDLTAFKHAFGKWIGLSYALGYIDGIEKERAVRLII